MRFGAAADDLAGTPWQELFTDDAVSYLESVVANRHGRVAVDRHLHRPATDRCDVLVRVRLGGLEDGSLVFVVSEPDENASEHGD
ncbi:hypothetical protein [Haloterrigena sp. H1]|uniref:hypothetical protein n=1 Tax=Haloterrigena sp. H1 TaxID=2552943 RepID=UPI002016F340|nr:hypothetical protein [Haloterrigena sp. H1]